MHSPKTQYPSADLLYEFFSPTELTISQTNYLEKMEKRYHDQKVQARIDKEVVSKKEKLFKVLTTLEKDIEDIGTRDIQKLFERLPLEVEERRKKRHLDLVVQWERVAGEFFKRLDNVDSTIETDILDRKYSVLFKKYWEEYARIEFDYVNELIQAIGRVRDSLENYRWLHQTVQDPMRLQHEAVAYGVQIALSALVEDTEGLLYLICERRKIDKKKEWSKIKEWLRQNQHRLFDAPKKGNNKEYLRVLAYITAVFEKTRHATKDSTPEDKKATWDKSYAQVYRYLTGKKRIWVKKIKDKKKKNESMAWCTLEWI